MDGLAALRKQVPFAGALPWHVPVALTEIVACAFGIVSAMSARSKVELLTINRPQRIYVCSADFVRS